ncbi:PEP-CTERM sorting domain-containing protein [Nostoc sp. T09]|nr:PEP-CTERM sorting domain-containing protein [Nostoc sp. T09]
MSIVAVPEPTPTLAILAVGVSGVILRRRQRR